ncbi:hypothetical protein Cgig2_013862 [Carnegiea gigantea]|uniref:Uncharacterized protein n=1 Tax=Carnegiea gigantea TaxID=171969 RepID=A0A9Q1QJ58_9CARY|nr:hypothetical protein Cgig2_013862 [Carnegiea gigantea]
MNKKPLNQSGHSFINKTNNKKKEEREEGGLCIQLSNVLAPLLLRSPDFSIQGVGGFIPGVLTLGGRRNKLHLLRVTALICSSLTLIHIVEVGLEGHQDFTQISKGLSAVLLVALLLYLSHLSSGIYQCLLKLALQLLLFGFTGVQISPQLFPGHWYRAISPSNLRHSAAALTPRANISAMAISSSVTLRGSEAAGVTKSQDLTKSWTSESLAVASALMKLVDGHWVIREEPPEAWEAASTADRSAPAPFSGKGVEAAASSSRPSVRCRFRTGRLMAGFFQRGTRKGAYGRTTQSVESRDYEKEGGKQDYTFYHFGLLGDKTLPFLFSPAIGVGRHLLWGDVPSLEDRQSYPRLIYIK